jgi:mannose-1-phosphate guanylyltransferase
MVYPVIMAGGVGSRFWPWSTPDQPKQFLRLLHPKKTMIEMTVDRFTPLFSRKNIRVVSHKNFRPL